MLNGGKAVRDRDGKIVEAAAFQKGEKEAEPGRVKPDRRWFGKQPFILFNIKVSLTVTAAVGNTRVISQSALDHFRTALKEQKADPYSVLLKRNKLPMGLLQDDTKDGGRVSYNIFFSQLLDSVAHVANSGPTLSRPSRLVIRLVLKRSENDLGLISVVLKNSASLLLRLLLLPPPRLPPPNPVRIASPTFFFFADFLLFRGKRYRRFGRHLSPHHLYRP